MRKTLRRAAWALAVGAGLGATGLAAAQAPERELVGMSPIQAATPRAREIRVELAWLADPLTFPHYLKARVTGSGLEVRGYLPTAAVRDRALAVARHHSPLPVIDHLKVHPNIPPRFVLPDPNLAETVQTALEGVLPAGATVSVRCLAPGCVALVGSVGSPEEQLAVCRALRRVDGCASVTCQLQAAAFAAPAPAPAPVAMNQLQIRPQQVTAQYTPLPVPIQTPSPPAAAVRRPTGVEKTMPYTLPSPPPMISMDVPVPPVPPVVQAVPTMPPPAKQTAPVASAPPPVPRPVEKAGGYTPPAPPALPAVIQAGNRSPAAPPGPSAAPATVRFEARPAPPAAPPELAARLRQRLMQVCGPAAKQIEVEFKSATAIQVRLTVASEAEGQRLGTMVMGLPELARYPHLDVFAQVRP